MRWILVSITVTKRGLEVSIRDNEGTLLPPTERIQPRSVRGGSSYLLIGHTASTARRTVSELWIPRPSRLRPVGMVYVNPPRGLAARDWERFVRALLPRYLHRGAPLARYVRPAAGRRGRFTLPFTVVTLADARPAVGAFTRRDWVRRAVDAGALKIRHMRGAGDLARALPAADADVVIAGGVQIDTVLDAVGGVPVSSRPQAIMSSDPRGVSRGPLVVPRGTSVYRLSGTGIGPFAGAVDESLAGMIGTIGANPAGAWIRRGGIVYGGPDTNYSRVGEMSEQVQVDAGQLAAMARALEALDPEASELGGVQRVLEITRQLVKDPGRGEPLLVRASRAASEVREAAKQVKAAVPRTITSQARRKLMAAQQRRVDIGLRHPGDAGETPTYVKLGSRLEAGQSYLLCVRIGQPFPESVLEGEPPSIDGLLPRQARKARQLSVVLYPKNMSVSGGLVRPLVLPEIGPSSLAEFRIHIPSLAHPVEARISIYHRNQLLQNYLFVADTKGTRGFLEFSQTERFQNLNRLGRRAVSLSLNADRSGRTHRLMVFRNGTPRAIEIPKATMQEAVDRFRGFLERATGSDPHNPRFATYPRDGDPIPPGFHEVLRDAIDLGDEIYRALLKDASAGDDGLDAELDRLRRSTNEPVQIVRLHRNYAFPWALVYDWDLPDDFPGEVCLGTIGGHPCGHDASSGVYCLNGFWGLRHVLEELIGRKNVRRDAVVRHAVVRRPGAVLLSADETASDLTKLQHALPDVTASLDPSENLLERIWAADHPAVAIIYGHTETTERNGRRYPRRIALPGGQWLSTRAIDRQERKAGKFPDPGPAILLLACDTALVELGTLNDFVSSFDFANAAAVLGTEAVVFRSLLARFAREMTVALAGGSLLGVALRDFRRRLTAAGNPIPFVFHAIGNAEFHLEWKEV